jgi:iron-sulfur cluster repair protein YtfE (RIC family)
VSTITPESLPADEAAALEQVCAHHERLVRQLDEHVGTLITAVVEGDNERIRTTRAAVVDYLIGELLPHADAEEDSVYPAARTIPWARAMTDELAHEHVLLNQLTQRLDTEPHPVRAATTAEALRVMFRHHVTSENTVVLPLVAAAPGLSLANLVAALHELGGH